MEIIIAVVILVICCGAVWYLYSNRGEHGTPVSFEDPAIQAHIFEVEDTNPVVEEVKPVAAPVVEEVKPVAAPAVKPVARNSVTKRVSSKSPVKPQSKSANKQPSKSSKVNNTPVTRKAKDVAKLNNRKPK